MSKISPCLWFDGEAEEAAKFYVSLLPDSRIEKIQKNTVDGPSGKAGSVLVVDFTLAGQRFMALNGGVRFEYTHAVSFKIDCADQAEVDRLWDALSANGGSVERCGWLKDRYGVSWQIVPTALRNISAEPTRPARNARCRRCWGWSSSTSRVYAGPMKANRPRDPATGIPRGSSPDPVSRPARTGRGRGLCLARDLVADPKSDAAMNAAKRRLTSPAVSDPIRSAFNAVDIKI